MWKNYYGVLFYLQRGPFYKSCREWELKDLMRSAGPSSYPGGGVRALSVLAAMCPLQKLPRQGEPMRPSGVSPSEACDSKPPVKSSLSPFLLDVLSIPNPVLGAAIFRENTICSVHIGAGFGKAAEKTGIWTPPAQEGTPAFLLVYLCRCFRKRQQWLGVSPLCFVVLCSPPSPRGIVTVVVPTRVLSTVANYQHCCFLWGVLLDKSSKRVNTNSFISTLFRQHGDCRFPDLPEKPFLFLGLGTSATSPIHPHQWKLSTVVFTAVILHGVTWIAWIAFIITTPI